MNDVNRWLWIAPVLAAVISGVLSWYISYSSLGLQVAQNKTELAERLVTRFSQDDALQLEARIRAEIERLDDRIDGVPGGHFPRPPRPLSKPTL